MRNGINLFASPPINVVAFICAKACAFGSCLFIPLSFLCPSLRWSEPTFVSISVSLTIFIVGAEIAVALHHLIVVREEAFLIAVRGDGYRTYMKGMDRHLLWI